MSDERADHWDAVFASRDLDSVSWFEEMPTHSAELLRAQPGSVIDIGAGASRLPGALLADGRDDITLLDISQEALAVTRERLGPGEDRVAYIVSDVLCWEPSRTYDVWHDRAVFHFLTAPADQAAYVDRAALALSAGGLLVLATFGPDGPTSCSGLPTARFSSDDIAALFAPAFDLTHAERGLTSLQAAPGSSSPGSQRGAPIVPTDPRDRSWRNGTPNEPCPSS